MSSLHSYHPQVRLNGKIPNKCEIDAESNFCCFQQIMLMHFKLLSTQIAFLVTVFGVADNFGLISNSNMSKVNNFTFFNLFKCRDRTKDFLYLRILNIWD